jgi:isoleucyl-tRNA synthetase
MSTEAQPTAAEKKSYKQTLNLPQTAFAMEAKLVQNEPKRLAAWDEARLYEKIITARASSPKGRWVLHDGPPFANGDIHIGHVINKTLKDVILRFRTMEGYQTPYVPGWDCHGLPIEHKIGEEIKKEGKRIHELGTLEVRRRCFEYASKYATVQCEQFKRLGILGEWNNPYLTMKPQYEAATLEVFAKFVEAGLVYRKLKPVPWSVANQTALADAELEYQDVQDQSVYVEFPVDPDSALAKEFKVPAYLLVWTTTPWTLPANLAVAVGPNIRYAFVAYEKNGESRIGIVAEDLVARVLDKRPGVTRWEKYPDNFSVTGEEMVTRGATYVHPFKDYKGKVVLADYVTTTDGTGLVHTAPGHGEDDYDTGIREGLEVYSPVLANGRFDDTVAEWLRGKSAQKEGNPLILQHLKDNGRLLAEETITHSYPHDWRSKTPIIFRATEQWFVALDKPFTDAAVAFSPSSGIPGEGRGGGSSSEGGATQTNPLPNPPPEYRRRGPEARSLRQRALDAITSQINFVPTWGQARIKGMLESRPDWCISRQRAWGLPIPVFYSEKGEPLLTPESVRAVAKRVDEKGSDVWFTETPTELLGCDQTICPIHFGNMATLRKEQDIFDVWFESGSSWHAVLQSRSYLKFPADLYLEGSDQHRGWFQLSLLPSLGAEGQPPFKAVLTHGFAVGPDGKKKSKSDKDYVTATQEIDRHGADLLRLWTCSVDYQMDIQTSPKTIQEFGDKYRKIRNTLRYLLSNLYDFNGRTQCVDIPPNSLDGWAIDQLDTLIKDVTAAYDAYQLHRAFRLLHDFCAVQTSAIYGNAMKDRLYCEAADSPLRRRCQTVMYRMVIALTKLLAPMIVFTADEAWEQIPHKPNDEADLPSVHLALLPQPSGQTVTDAVREEWSLLMELRDSALLQLDALKKEAGLNKALESEVVYHLGNNALRMRLQAYSADLEDLVGAGHHAFSEDNAQHPAVKVFDTRRKHAACARCWKRRPDVGQDAEHADLCLRCAKAVRGA